jgi:hypothetical protein
VTDNEGREDLLREFTKKVQQETATVRDLTEQVQSLLVASRKAVDTLTFTPAPATSTEPAATPLDAAAEKFAQHAATYLQQATIHVALGEPAKPVGVSVADLIAAFKSLGTSEQLAPIREILAREIVNLAGRQVSQHRFEANQVLTEESVKLLLKVAIQGIRGTLTSQDVAEAVKQSTSVGT